MTSPRSCLVCQRIMKQYEEALLHEDRLVARDILRRYDEHRDANHKQGVS